MALAKCGCLLIGELPAEGMATTKPTLEGAATAHPLWQPAGTPFAPISSGGRESRTQLKPSSGDALQALLAFSALHQQVRQRRALAARRNIFEPGFPADFEASEQFVLDEVLHLVAERAIAITGADGLGIALAENNEIVLRASAGAIKPGAGARIQRDSAFSGACFRTAQIIRCDDTESDSRVNREACRQLGARSMVAVPLCGRRRVIGVLEAFSAEPFGFNDSDVGSLQLLAELILGALKPEDEDRFAESALVAEAELTSIENAAGVLSASAQNSSEKEVATAEAEIELPSALLESAHAAIHEDKYPIKNLLSAEVSSQIKHSEERHPGMLVVLILVAAASMFAAGMWWKLTMSRPSTSTVQSVQKKITEPIALPANPPSSIISTGASQSAETNSAASQGPPTEAGASRGNVAHQALKLPRITGIRHWSSSDSSTVVLDLENRVQYEAHRISGPDRIYFDLHDTSPAPELEGKIVEIGDALLARIRVAQPVSGLTRVVLETKSNPNYSVSLESNPYRLVVLVRKPGAGPEGRLNPFPGAAAGAAEKMEIIVPPPSQEDLQLRARVQKMRIVVDPGHGGWDLGTVGRHGLLEKDLVLEIAQRLGQLLQSRLGADVILTRNGDNYIPLDQRAEVANQSQADLFVSIHANYSNLPSARGVETYYTNSFSAPEAKDPDANDKDTGKPDHSNVSAAVLSSAELRDKIEQSRRLAATVQRSLYATLSVENTGFRDRGVKAASYVVLTETAMPGILAEVSFVSSPTDEQRLRSDGYREQIAEALYKAIARYAASSHGEKVASAAK
jgi:N-acetylmuramoyl-L-alanine amidase/putative methionine-R-sulfoxide reductase with GAF domain